MSNMKQRHCQLDNELATFAYEYISFSQGLQTTADMEITIAQNAVEIDLLKAQLDKTRKEATEFFNQLVRLLTDSTRK